MSTNAFTPQGNTVTFTAAATPPTPVQGLALSLGSNQYRCINAGNVTVFLGVGANATVATAAAVVVTSTQASVPLVPGAVEVLTFGPNFYFTGATASGTAIVYVTPGDGM